MKTGKQHTSLHARFRQLSLFYLRNELKLSRLRIDRLEKRNASFTGPVVSCREDGAVVSLTTYGERLSSVHLLLESIGAGSLLPSRLILWVDTEDAFRNPSVQLRRLMERGLELRMSENYGPHTKYYPYLLETETFSQPLVTADDDQLYPPWWLEGLVKAYRESPACVNCYRAHRIHMAGEAMVPYESWKPCKTSAPSYLHFATGVSGVIYPPFFLEQLKAAGPAFRELCPRADDAWLHVQALRGGTPVRQVYDRSLRFPTVPGSQATGLFHSNVLQSQNDRQIAFTYRAGDIALLRESAAQAD